MLRGQPCLKWLFLFAGAVALFLVAISPAYGGDGAAQSALRDRLAAAIEMATGSATEGLVEKGRPWPPETLAGMALARLGDVDRARAVAPCDDWVLCESAIATLRRSGPAQALRVADQIRGDWSRYAAMRAIALWHVQAGELGRAAAVSDMLGEGQKTLLLMDVAAAATERGANTEALSLLDEVLGLVNALAEPGSRYSMLIRVAEAQHKAGGEARETLNAALLDAGVAEDTGWWPRRASSLQMVAAAYAKAGMVEKAAEIFSRSLQCLLEWDGQEQERDRLADGEVRALIAEAQADAGLWDEATDTASRIGVEGSRLFDEHYYVRGHGMGREDQPKPTEKDRVDYSLKLLQFATLFSIRLSRGDLGGALWYHTLYTATDGPSDELAVRLVHKAGELATAGYLYEAVVVAGSIAELSRKAQAFLVVARAEALKGRTGRAALLANKIFWPVYEFGSVRVFSWQEPETWGLIYSNYTYHSVAGVWDDEARAADLAAAAMRLEQTIGPPAGRDYASAFQGFSPGVLRALARAHAETGDPEAAFAWSKKIEDADGRLLALIGIVEAFTGQGSLTADRQPVAVER